MTDEDRPQTLLRRLRWLFVFGGLFIGLWFAVVAGNSVGRYMGWMVPAESPARSPSSCALLPHREARGPGALPTALLYSGCDGPSDAAERWSQMLVARGWAAIAVDSHGPRDFVDSDIWRLICAGQLLMGSSGRGRARLDLRRAAAALRRPGPAGAGRRLARGLGDHGAAGLREGLAPALQPHRPARGRGRASAPGRAGIVLAYPYCGAANRARRIGWRWPAPTLFLLAENDLIAPADDCLEVADLLKAQGEPVETVVFPGATHGFDQQTRKPFSTLVFDPEIAAEALTLAGDFLDRAIGEAPRP